VRRVHISIKDRSTPVKGRWSAVCVLYLIFAAAAGAQAQTLSTSQKFSLGIKAAPNFTIARYRDPDLRDSLDARYVFGYTVGGQIKFPLKDNYSFLSEIGFAQKGRNTEFDLDGRNKGTYYFIDASMALRKSFKVKIFKNVPTNVYLSAGPNIAYWLSGFGTLSYDPGGSARYSIVFNEEPTSDFSKYYYNDANRWLFGLDFGLGGDAPLMPGQRIFYEFRATIGQTQLGKKNSTATIELVPRPYDNLLCALISYQFQLTYTFEFDTRAGRKGESVAPGNVQGKKKKAKGTTQNNVQQGKAKKAKGSAPKGAGTPIKKPRRKN
jgi:hypothetical protein